MLYIVATPIGNLDDLSIRQAEILSQSDVILAEDTRSAYILLDAIAKRFNHYANRQHRIISYYKEKEFEKLPEVMDALRGGKTVSLISESGMPLICDPGSLLIKQVIKEHIPFTVIPGPSAATTALVLSGFSTEQCMFVGFLPTKKSALVRLINQWKHIKEIFPNMSMVFFESPNRIRESLRVLDDLFPNIQIAICREMTKKFEEVIRGAASELMKREYKGELTVIVG